MQQTAVIACTEIPRTRLPSLSHDLRNTGNSVPMSPLLATIPIVNLRCPSQGLEADYRLLTGETVYNDPTSCKSELLP